MISVRRLAKAYCRTRRGHLFGLTQNSTTSEFINRFPATPEGTVNEA